MTDAPERIWAFAADHIAEDEGGATIVAHEDAQLGAVEYHLARPNQPCSTDEFLRRVRTAATGVVDVSCRVSLWVDGDFTAAMEGLE